MTEAKTAAIPKMTTPPEAAATTPTTPLEAAAAATTPTTLPEAAVAATTPTMPIVLIEDESNALTSRKKQKTIAGAEKNYSDGNVSKIFENICKYTTILNMHNFL